MSDKEEWISPLDRFKHRSEDLGYKEDAYLRTKGWRCSCEKFSLWLWYNEKLEISGASKSTAMFIQNHIDYNNHYNATSE